MVFITHFKRPPTFLLCFWQRCLRSVLACRWSMVYLLMLARRLSRPTVWHLGNQRGGSMQPSAISAIYSGSILTSGQTVRDRYRWQIQWRRSAPPEWRLATSAGDRNRYSNQEMLFILNQCWQEIAASLTAIPVTFIHSGYIYSTSSSTLLLRGASKYSIDSVSELARRNVTGNCEWRTCPRFLRGCYRVGFEPVTHRQGTELTIEQPRPIFDCLGCWWVNGLIDWLDGYNV